MDNKVAQIDDMYFASALLAYGFEYMYVDKSNLQRQKFVFQDGMKVLYQMQPDKVVEAYGTIEDARKFYLAGILLLPPDYPEMIRKIRYIIHSKDDNDGDGRERMGGSKITSDQLSASQVG